MNTPDSFDPAKITFGPSKMAFLKNYILNFQILGKKFLAPPIFSKNSLRPPFFLEKISSHHNFFSKQIL